jgi:ATP-binding cassette subfamily B protein
LALLLFGSIGLQLLNPQILRHFIDAAYSDSSLEVLYTAAGLFLGVGLFHQALSALTAYVGNDLGWRATNRLRADLLRHLLRLDMPFHYAHTPGELLERLDGDVTRLANFFSHFAVRLLGNFLLAMGILTLLFREDSRLGLALSLFVGTYLGVHFWGQRLAVPHWHAERQASAQWLGFLGERLSGIKDLRTSGAIEYTLRRFCEGVRQAFWTGFKADLITDIGWSLSNITYALGYAMAMVLGAYLFYAKAITLGVVYLVIHYLDLLRTPLNTLRGEIEDLQQARVSIERIEALIRLQPQIRDGPGMPLPPGPLSVEFCNVSFAYQPGQPVLREVSFGLLPGRVLGLLGHTGSGKTTLSRLLFRLCEATEGTLRLGGVNIRDTRLAEVRQRVGLVTQEVQLFRASVRDNLTLFDLSISDEKILESIETLGLEGWYHSLDQGLDTELGAGGKGLSAGQAQLLAFTRVFLKDPGLVVMDEAASRLDRATEGLLEQAMDRLLKNRTAILIAHRLCTIQRADEIVILQGGRIKEQGPYGLLAADPHSRFSQLLRRGLEEVRS